MAANFRRLFNHFRRKLALITDALIYSGATPKPAGQHFRAQRLLGFGELTFVSLLLFLMAALSHA